jgi:hypothetical protein
MSSRQEEKEQRKAERLERERAAASEAKRKRLLQIVGGVVVGAAVIVGVVLAVSGGGSGASRPSESAVASAATAAGCVYKSFPDEGRGHVATALTAKNFKTNPPTSGNHNPTPAPDGEYQPGNEPAIANWVHTLEHGRVILQYKQGAPTATVSALQKLYKEPVLDSGGSYHMVLMQNNTKMPFEAAAVAWRHYVGCKDAGPASIKAMRLFRDAFVDKGPEFIP